MFKPLSNNIFIEPIEKESKSGIIIPETARKDQPVFGKVIAVGEKVLAVKIDDKVLFKKYMVDSLSVDGKDYLVGQEDGVIAIIND